ncbi:DUF4118 domain-containing protein [Mahella australiensis]|uniref:histidine kinase n=1 Tax=Mahella australiensis (strain DSM 15567 / CIP 107919 / 50-1 BON) TaxID=697281 RepID=F4A0C6_MAHA5|nr:DUF4118 domain-containing protein [Mahella australiensis]AEE97987.1 integral membrane sensor signal transduction histidine kinase [Mahella australiensis 50-1 BON]
MLKKHMDKQIYNDAVEFQHYCDLKPRNIILRALKNISIVIGIMIIATLISYGFRALGFHESNYIMIYILGVMIIASITDGYLYGIMASALSVLTFNYFFTEPYYTLLAYSPEYPVTFIIMLIVALITSTLAARIKHESQRAELREMRIRILYQIEKDLLAVKNIEQVAQVAAKDISKIFRLPVMLSLADMDGGLTIDHIEGDDIFNSYSEMMARTETFQSGNACGARTRLFADSRAYFQPISGQNGVLGVIGIGLGNADMLTEGQKSFIDTIATQIAPVLERERLYEKQQRAKIEMEHERLRSDLLRAISHDLRTPLTSILGSSSTVIENYDVLTDEMRRDFLQDIYDDAEWLSILVENILSMTRFSEGRIELKKEMEAVEEIVAEAVSRVNKRAKQHEISVSVPKELIMIPVDGILIEQVLINLLDNALKYTLPDSKINVSVKKEDGKVMFQVSDNGPGIPEEELPFIFNRFYTKNLNNTSRPGMGLGLAICKSIVEAHGGEISADNDPAGGAVFRFTIPIREEDHESIDTDSR